jgi:hypothetical protein
MGRLAGALKIELNDNAILPAATICNRSEAEAIEAVFTVGREFQANAPSHWMSVLQDLKAHRPLEIHETLGYALNKAQEQGLQMPLVDAFYHLIAALDRFSQEIWTKGADTPLVNPPVQVRALKCCTRTQCESLQTVAGKPHLAANPCSGKGLPLVRRIAQIIMLPFQLET